MIDRPLTYLAGPYSHKHRTVRVRRFHALNRAAAHLMMQGHNVFSPISHSHPLADKHDLPKGWEFWEKFDRAYLRCSRQVIVLTLDGWKTSTGVNAEIKIAVEMGIPISYMNDKLEMLEVS
jgi:hypothetical protein